VKKFKKTDIYMHSIILKISFLICILAQINLSAQDMELRNSFYAELGGNGEYISVNYERFFFREDTSVWKLCLRQGISASGRKDHTTLFGFPFEINCLVGKQRHFLEFGAGYTPFIGNSKLDNPNLPVGYKTNFDYSYFFRLGYRLITKGDAVIRIAPLGRFYHNPPQRPNLIFTWWPSASFGIMF
jgi:hypothetical protein